jgi:hypothetical protein
MSTSAIRRYNRQKDREVKKMYEKEMKKMSTMTDQQKVTHLHYLSMKNKPTEEDLLIKPIDTI